MKAYPNFGNRSVRFGNCSEIARRLNSNGQRLKKYCKKNDKYSKTVKRRKSQDSRIEISKRWVLITKISSQLERASQN
jgi:hypothetical protein